MAMAFVLVDSRSIAAFQRSYQRSRKIQIWSTTTAMEAGLYFLIPIVTTLREKSKERRSKLIISTKKWLVFASVINNHRPTIEFSCLIAANDGLFGNRNYLGSLGNAPSSIVLMLRCCSMVTGDGRFFCHCVNLGYLANVRLLMLVVKILVMTLIYLWLWRLKSLALMIRSSGPAIALVDQPKTFQPNLLKVLLSLRCHLTISF